MAPISRSGSCPGRHRGPGAARAVALACGHRRRVARRLRERCQSIARARRGARARAATRAALGAGRRRLVRQLLVENVTLAVVAGVIGALASFATLQLVVALLPADLPRLPEIRVDLRVLAFALGASLATGVVFGLLPALRATRAGAALVARGTGAASIDGGESRITRGLAAVQLAFAVVLRRGGDAVDS